MSNKKIHGAQNAGSRDAQARINESRVSVSVAPPQPQLPEVGLIWSGMILESPMQITRDMVTYMAQQVWRERVANGLEQDSFMPDNWLGGYIVSAVMDRLVRLGQPSA